jgi:thymidylate synthase
MTTKRIHLESVIFELIWFLAGLTNIKFLTDNKVRIWTPWANKNGDLGPVYGAQWRNAGGVDQLQQLVDGIKNNPNSRRLLVNAWNVRDLDKMALMPCHLLFQCYVQDKVLHMQVYQRSADIFLGVPFNIASYAILLNLLAAETGLWPGRLRFAFGDVHLYKNHFEQAKLQLSRKPLQPSTRLPLTKIDGGLTSLNGDDHERLAKIANGITDELYTRYRHSHPRIKAPIAV